MAFRLGEHVTYVELRHRGYTTFGVFVARGMEEHPFTFELTGTPSEDLIGKTIRFSPMTWPDQSTPDEARKDLKGFSHMQIGVTGQMTADSWVRIFDVPVEEIVANTRKGPVPPARWVRRVYLEWYSQNGRVVLECPVDLVEEEIGEDNWEPLPIATLPPYHPDRPKEELEAPTGIEALSLNADGTTEQMTFITSGDPLEAAEFMDALIERNDAVPVASLFGEPRQVPDPDTLSEDQAEIVFKSILVELALRGVAVHVCEHYTPKSAYKLLVSRMLHENEVHPEAAGSGWIQNISTYEFCPQCAAEFETNLPDPGAEEEDESP